MNKTISNVQPEKCRKNENYRKHDSSKKWDTLNKKYYELYRFIIFIYSPSGAIDSKIAIKKKKMFTFFMKVHFGLSINS